MRLVMIAAAGLVTVAGPVLAASDLPPLQLAEVYVNTMPVAPPGVGFYPKDALRARVEGHATVVCTVMRSGHMGGCAVTEETPSGYGFGAKVLDNSRTLQVGAMSRFGAPTHGRQLEIPMKFTLPPAT